MLLKIAFSLLLIFLVTPTIAQDVPAGEAFVGYSYANIAPDLYAYKINGNGGHTNLTWNTKLVGFTTDFSAHTGTSLGQDARVYNLMFGPRFSRRGKKITWFVHSLYGFSKINSDIRLGGVAAPNAPPGFFIAYSESDSSFAFSPGGGGLDVKVNNRLALRVIQFDLLFTRCFSTGLVIRWGQK